VTTALARIVTESSPEGSGVVTSPVPVVQQPPLGTLDQEQTASLRCGFPINPMPLRPVTRQGALLPFVVSGTTLRDNGREPRSSERKTYLGSRNRSASALIVVGTDHRLADPEPLGRMLKECDPS
jgi:hypothetical protein